MITTIPQHQNKRNFFQYLFTPLYIGLYLCALFCDYRHFPDVISSFYNSLLFFHLSFCSVLYSGKRLEKLMKTTLLSTHTKCARLWNRIRITGS